MENHELKIFWGIYVFMCNDVPFFDWQPILGHMQAVLTQFRRRITRRLNWVNTVCLQEFLCKIQ